MDQAGLPCCSSGCGLGAWRLVSRVVGTMAESMGRGIVPPYSEEHLAFASYIDASHRSFRWYSWYKPAMWRQGNNFV